MKRIILLSTCFVHAISVWSGVVSGGGGYAVVCEDNVTLLDIYEGSKLPNFKMATTTGTIEEDYFLGVKRTYEYQGGDYSAEERREEIINSLRSFFARVVFVDDAADLPLSNDVGPVPLIPSDCKLEQIAFFDDNAEIISIVRSRFEELDALNQAALVSHELSYHYFRGLKESTSALSRLQVAHIYAVVGPTPLDDGLNETSLSFSSTHCGENYGLPQNECLPSSSFWITKLVLPDARSITRVQFSQIAGRQLLSKTWVDVPTAGWDLRFGRFAAPSTKDGIGFGCIVKDQGHDDIYNLVLEGSQIEGARFSIQLSSNTDQPLTIAPVVDDVVGIHTPIMGGC